MAKDFGFCWGVERSIAMAYEARSHFPDRKLHITNELIHNPQVNGKLEDMKVNFIPKVRAGAKQQHIAYQKHSARRFAPRKYRQPL